MGSEQQTEDETVFPFWERLFFRLCAWLRTLMRRIVVPCVGLHKSRYPEIR